jgi:hypothetical protein
MARRPVSDAELEATLRDIGAHLRAPEAPHLAARVRARLAERPQAARRPWVFALAPAVLTVLVIGAGATATEVIRLRGVDVFPVPAVSAPPRQSLDVGDRVSFDAARAAAQPLVSTDPIFARPDEVYLRKSPAGEQVYYAYHARPGLAAGPTGYGALVGQFVASLDASLIGKGVGPDTKVENVTVGGEPGIWIEGESHFFFYRDARGEIHQETLRLAGNTLLWEHQGKLVRLEAQVSRSRALEIASSFR